MALGFLFGVAARRVIDITIPDRRSIFKHTACHSEKTGKIKKLARATRDVKPIL
jgi:hypothetical protein